MLRSADHRSSASDATRTVAPSVPGEPLPSLQSVAGLSTPPPEVIALHKLTYGPRPGDVERVRAMGVTAFIDEQLNPDRIDDSALNTRIAAAGFQLLDASIPTLWARQSLSDGQERDRAWREVRHHTWLRALFSRRQLFEVLVDHWHNHFNVSANVWPISFIMIDYDRRIRRHALGNFREFLEDIATAPAMLIYLNNGSNTVAGPNENYARELFELHTLGIEAYIPGIQALPPSQRVEGYRDWDVYEAARCFTGWTLRNRSWDRNHGNTGEFFYRADWHDRFQKFLLNEFVPPEQAPMKDGRDVLDRVARHPATARNVARRLARRFIADRPSESVVRAGAQAFLDTRAQPDQLRHVTRAILTHPDFLNSWGHKLKRPNELIASVLRATDSEWAWNGSHDWQVTLNGQQHFQWGPPDGYPDRREAWTNSTLMLRRFNYAINLCEHWIDGSRANIVAQTPAEIQTPRQIAQFWADRIYGFRLSEAELQPVVAYLARTANPDANLTTTQRRDRLPSAVALLFTMPHWQLR